MIGFVSQHYHLLLYVLIAVLGAAGIGTVVYFKWYRPKQQRASEAHPAGQKGQSATASVR
jgi:hypothetical protein